MPLGLAALPPVDLDQQDASAAALPLDQGLHTGEAFGHFDFSQYAGHFLGDGDYDLNHPLAGVKRQIAAQVDPETLNEKYAVPGALRFNEPATEYDAAFRQHMALQRQFRDTVFARTNPQPLTDFGAGLAGSLVDPAAAATMVATGGLGEAVVGGVAARLGIDATAPAVTTLGKLASAARVPLTGAIDNIPFVGANAALTNAAGDEYDAGDALRDIAAGAVLHTASHLAFRSVPALFRRGGAAMDPGAPADASAGETPPLRPALEPDPAPAAGVPPEVDALPETARRGAFVAALDDLAADRPVDVATMVQQELEARADTAEAARPRELENPIAEQDQPGAPTAAASRAAAPGDVTGPPQESPNEAASILADTNRRFASGDVGDLQDLRPPGRSDGAVAPTGGEPGSLGGVDARDGGGGNGEGESARAGEEGRPPAVGSDPDHERDAGNKSAPRVDIRALIAANPELKALADDTARWAAQNGLAEPAAGEGDKPIAEAIQAAAQCLLAAPEEIF